MTYGNLKSTSVLMLALGLPVASPPALAGGCEAWLPGPLFHQSEGIDGGEFPRVTTSAQWTPPTGGPPLLVVGGSFSSAGGVAANNIAAWDGASWRALGLGVGGPVATVVALAVYNGDLIAGGQFTEAGGAPAHFIARFDGTTWHPLGDGLHQTASNFVSGCWALTVYNGELIAGGRFNQSGNTVLVNIGRWNGSTWSPLGGAAPPFNGAGTIGTSDEVESLRVHTNNALYIGGWFQSAGGVNASNIVKSDNGTFSPLTSGTLGSVGALHSFGSDLVLGGFLIQAGGMPAQRIARWNPTTEIWGTFGPGLGDNDEGVFALQPFNGMLVAGGNFPGGISAWNGSSWVGVGGNLSGGIVNQPRAFALNVFSSQLIAGGDFDAAGGGSVAANNIAQFDAISGIWSAMQVPAAQVFAFETLGSRIIAGGVMLHSTTSSAPAHNLIGWNGDTLTPLQNGICCGEGTNGTVRALKSFTIGSGSFQTRNLIVGGDFTFAGGLAANRVAHYIEPAITPPSWSTLGSGFNNSVFAIERFNGTIYAGGQFTASGATTVNDIAQFNGTNWVAVSSGMNGTVHALKVYNGFLYAGGTFTSAGGVSTGGLARWNGTSWSNVGGFFTGTVLALEVHNNELIIGGQFPGLNAPNIAKYNGTIYSNLGAGGTNGAVTSLKSDGTHVYCLGGFTTAGGVVVNHVARWNATDGWSDVDGGTNEAAQALGVFQNAIHVGLGPIITIAGGAPQPGNGWIRFGATGEPAITQQPVPQTVDCGQNATFSLALAPSFFTATMAWRKDGTLLSDGPTGSGSTISGANTASLMISNVGQADAGSYDCVVTNQCGSTTSDAAPLTVNNCCAPDVNNSGAVDVDDLVAVILAWGECPAPPDPCDADADGSGSADVDDLIAVILGWGTCP